MKTPAPARIAPKIDLAYRNDVLCRAIFAPLSALSRLYILVERENAKSTSTRRFRASVGRLHGIRSWFRGRMVGESEPTRALPPFSCYQIAIIEWTRFNRSSLCSFGVGLQLNQRVYSNVPEATQHDPDTVSVRWIAAEGLVHADADSR